MNTVTAGILLIGDELLSGRTQDTNSGDIARFLGPLGVQVGEVRMLPDDTEIIIANVREFSNRFDYVFTTGGIGPTHDDITADCIAAAFDLKISERQDAIDELLVRYKPEDLNPARRRMARIPDGASLIKNPVSLAPGFQTNNVFTLAGVPQIMRAMLDDIGHRIKGGKAVLQRTIPVKGMGEGDVAGPLGVLAAKFPDLSFGSYPFFNDGGYGLRIVIRGTDETRLGAAEAALIALLGY
ncbi:MAG: competence/damage-inducible protein A [Hellea sp.]|nr:competence/damage-inducible protein A [Hellea sp.]